uniref:Uncharacterized protein n=1 Tax=Kalanchoe fedtschenkoi TaxID=63787 RepID=A0A7N0T072_KALFE
MWRLSHFHNLWEADQSLTARRRRPGYARIEGSKHTCSYQEERMMWTFIPSTDSESVIPMGSSHCGSSVEKTEDGEIWDAARTRIRLGMLWRLTKFAVPVIRFNYRVRIIMV